MRRAHFTLGAAGLLLTAICSAQNQTPPGLLNLPHPSNLQGPSATASVSQSGRETVDIGMGTLSVFLPVLDLPQKGGSNLRLGYVYNNNALVAKETSVTYNQYGTANGSNPQTWWLEPSASLGWIPNHIGPHYGLDLNFPTLNADLLYMGSYQTNSYLPNYWPSYCLANWTFSDWQGAAHTFNGFRDCTTLHGYFTSSSWLETSEADDDSGYRIDLASPSDPKVVGPDGVVYHFPAYTPPGNDGGAPNVYSSGGYQQLNYYSREFASSVDPNGNTIAYANNVLTDTTGRQVHVDTYHGLSWNVQSSPTASPNMVSVTKANSNSGQTVPFDVNQTDSCQFKSPNAYLSDYQAAQAAGYHGPSTQSSTPPDLPSGNTAVLTLPDGSFYQLDSDPYGRLSKIRYPTGGYTRYDYEFSSTTNTDEGDMTCVHPTIRVVAKHECSAASGNCTQSPLATSASCTAGFPSGGEATTCYQGWTVTNPKLEPTAYEFSLSYSEPPNGQLGHAPHFPRRWKLHAPSIARMVPWRCSASTPPL